MKHLASAPIYGRPLSLRISGGIPGIAAASTRSPGMAFRGRTAHPAAASRRKTAKIDLAIFAVKKSNCSPTLIRLRQYGCQMAKSS